MPRVDNIEPILSVKEITDPVIRENFQALIDYFREQNQLYGFQHLEFEITAAEANIRIRHGLSYAPKDVIITRVVGLGTLTLNYSLFDSEYIDVSATGVSANDPLRVRCFVGTHHRDNSTSSQSGTQQWKASVS
jgi:hypothetical protein